MLADDTNLFSSYSNIKDLFNNVNLELNLSGLDLKNCHLMKEKQNTYFSINFVKKTTFLQQLKEKSSSGRLQ